jgi:hypothetical protein
MEPPLFFVMLFLYYIHMFCLDAAMWDTKTLEVCFGSTTLPFFNEIPNV